jgi:hypothetical protein
MTTIMFWYQQRNFTGETSADRGTISRIQFFMLFVVVAAVVVLVCLQQHTTNAAQNCTTVGQYLNTVTGNCTNCPMGKYYPFSDVTSNDTSVITVTLTSCKDCTAGTYSSQVAQVYCFGCSEGNYSFAGASSCTPCPANSTSGFAASSYASCYCKDGFYGQAWKNSSCKPCPKSDGLYCPFNVSYVHVSEGYYWKPDMGDQVYQCFPTWACVESSGASGTECAEFYSGVRCGDCIQGVSYRSNYECKKCPSKAAIAFTVIAVLLLFLFICYRFSRSMGSIPVDVKLVFMTLQMIVLYPSFFTGWPNNLNNLFRVISFIVRLVVVFNLAHHLLKNFNIELFSPECGVKIDFWGKYVLKMMIPLMVLATIVPFSAVMAAMSGRKQKGFEFKQYLFSQGVPLLILFVITMYAFLVSAAVSPFKCNYGTDNTLYDDPSKICFSAEWNSKLPMVIFFMIVYIIALPGTLVYMLWKNRETVNSEKFKNTFGSITRMYKEEMYWWELIQVLKRTLFAGTNAFLRMLAPQDTAIFATLCILCTFQVVESSFMPFKEHSHFLLSIA